jgi:hypothetical protein
MFTAFTNPNEFGGISGEGGKKYPRNFFNVCKIMKYFLYMF